MKITKIVLFLGILVTVVSAQNVELEQLIAKADKARTQYTEKFKNLSAEELKTNKYYKKDGALDETRIIKSLFIVYQSPRDGRTDEFRNVIEYNGKNVMRSDEKIADFFEKLAQADSDKKEYVKLREESNRFDGKVHSWGMTLWQESPFGALRPYFDIKIIGREKIEGRETIVLEYSQIKPTTLIMANPTEEENKLSNGRQYNTFLPDGFRPTNPRMSGKIWLDAETAQIWRNEFKITLYPASLSKGVVTTEIFYQYQSSKFGILVPQSFRFVGYKLEGKDDKTLKVTKSSDRLFEYSNYTEIDTEIKKYEVGKQQ